jgi:purine-binding chemotaxis protein CheW
MPVAISLNTDAEVGDANLTQYLTCLLAGEQYGIGILQVQEIRGWEQVTRIPNTPGFVKGVINLRGAIIPVLDLRLRFGLPAEPYGKETVVIVVRSKSRRGDDRSMGLIVDAVSDVIVADDDQIIATPEFGANVRTENIFGLVKQDDGMVRLLDVKSLLMVAGGDDSE